MQGTAQTFFNVCECKLIPTLTSQLGTRMHKDCRGRGGKGLVTIKGSRKSNPFCKSFCFLTENTSSHHSCASPRPCGHTPRRTPRAQPSAMLSAWNSWLTSNCHKTLENGLWLLEKDSWHAWKPGGLSRHLLSTTKYLRTILN